MGKITPEDKPQQAKVALPFWNCRATTASQLSIRVVEQNYALNVAHIIPKTTGSYFIVVSVEESPAAHTHWVLAYGFR